MKTLYTDMDIHFSMDNISIHALNIVFEHFTRTIPSHSHGNGCYEIHYIPFGCGKLIAEVNIMTYPPTPSLLSVLCESTPKPRYSRIPCRNTAFI